MIDPITIAYYSNIVGDGKGLHLGSKTSESKSLGETNHEEKHIIRKSKLRGEVHYKDMN